MKNEIYTVETEGNLEYGIRAIVCEDPETVIPWFDPKGNGNQDECNSVCRDTHAAIKKLLPAVSAMSDSYLANWNGGMYSHQANIFGYSVVKFGAVKCFFRKVALEDEDGDMIEMEWENLTLDKMPQSVIRAMEAVEEVHSKAIQKAMRRAIREAIREVEAVMDHELENRYA